MKKNNIQIILIDCTPRKRSVVNEVFNSLSVGKFWRNNFAPQILVGYNPLLNGRTKKNRGCGNNCVTCDYGVKISSKDRFKKTTLKNMPDAVEAMLEKSSKEVRKILVLKKANFFNENYIHLRISGGIQGDPLMTDRLMTLYIIDTLRNNFKTSFISIDTTANLNNLSERYLYRIRRAGLNQVNVSVNCFDQKTYGIFFGLSSKEANKRFDIMKKNIKRIDGIGLKVVLSCVYGNHKNNPEKFRKKLPKFMANGQTHNSMSNFVKSLRLNQNPKLRLWPLDLTKNNLKKMMGGDIEYCRR